MKPTSKNLHGSAVLAACTRNSVELTGSGKIHDSFGILAEFTNREAAIECLTQNGFVHDPLDRRGYPVYKRTKS